MVNVLILIGFFSLTFSIIFLIWHFIRKIGNRNLKLSKKLFYSTFLGGLLFLIIGVSFSDTGIQEELDEVTIINKELTEKIVVLEKNIDKLQIENDKLIKENDKFTEDLNKATVAMDSAKKFETENKNLQKSLLDLTEKNKSFEDQISDLKIQLAEKETAVLNTSTSSSFDSSSSSGGSEYFSNCTELRTVYPSGVASDHPAYQSKMDRDKDNWACER